MKSIGESTDSWFKCGCKEGGKPLEWRITSHDEKGITEKPDNVILQHECANVIIWRQFKSIKRFYMNKKALSEAVDKPLA